MPLQKPRTPTINATVVLGAAGLLDARRCTTHWRRVEELRERVPLAEVDPDVLFVDDDDLSPAPSPTPSPAEWWTHPSAKAADANSSTDPYPRGGRTASAQCSVQVSALKVALLAVGAAVLWAAGTVLGRMVSAAVGPRDLTVLRYSWGLPAAAVITWQTHAAFTPGWHNVWGLVLLALIPGLASLSLYYVGLQATAASRATFAELAFPGTAAIVGVLFLNSHLSATQWLGFAIVVASITGLGWHERTRQPAVAERPIVGEITTLTAASVKDVRAIQLTGLC